MQRRTFIHQFGLGAVALGTGIPQLDFSGDFSLSILHTNDLHGRFEGNKAAYHVFAQQARQFVQKIRQEQAHVLLLDAGDVLNPSNSKGEELAWMKGMGYDAFALGNHDFDRGMQDLSSQLSKNPIPALAANYQLADTPLVKLVKPYHIVEKAGQRIGIMGLGVNPEGSIPQLLREGLVYTDPLATANQVAVELKEKHACNLVICLSHLGYHYKDEQISDLKLAPQSRHIDIIIGGHTHTFLPEPIVVNNLDGKPVLINHAGWGGLLMGRIDLQYSNGAIRVAKGENVAIGAQNWAA
ncbi:bifunctional metallophosphatase/5'-nucleotidase [Haliscomenobacter sp.]|uniref:bifunctional metallophosphatase/5'-nucleotidase n=1 Tax=Haliscomenobacter sp. TaxID=2717303 RepID=UPI003BAD8964